MGRSQPSPLLVGNVIRPLRGVLTSVAYGAGFGGVAVLLGMLNSCASGVFVVNSENGFGAGYQASLINMIAVKRSGGESVHGPAQKGSKPHLAKACR
jgi:NCAIR mutase (PurE)-related protein